MSSIVSNEGPSSETLFWGTGRDQANTYGGWGVIWQFVFLETKSLWKANDVWTDTLLWRRTQLLFIYFSGLTESLRRRKLINCLSTICNNCLSHFSDFVRCCACRWSFEPWSTPTDCRSSLKRLYHNKVLLCHQMIP